MLKRPKTIALAVLSVPVIAVAGYAVTTSIASAGDSPAATSPAGATHDVGDDHGVDDPATHDVGDDHGVDDPATHDVGDDHGVDDPATHDVGDGGGHGSDDHGGDGGGHGSDD